MQRTCARVCTLHAAALFMAAPARMRQPIQSARKQGRYVQVAQASQIVPPALPRRPRCCRKHCCPTPCTKPAPAQTQQDPRPQQATRPQTADTMATPPLDAKLEGEARRTGHMDCAAFLTPPPPVPPCPPAQATVVHNSPTYPCRMVDLNIHIPSSDNRPCPAARNPRPSHFCSPAELKAAFYAFASFGSGSGGVRTAATARPLGHACPVLACQPCACRNRRART
jgi:hypothetical protein